MLRTSLAATMVRGNVWQGGEPCVRGGQGGGQAVDETCQLESEGPYVLLVKLLQDGSAGAAEGCLGAS